LDAKGQIGAKAQELYRKITNSPALRGSQRDALVAFEESIGIGTAKVFELRVAHTGQNYILADVKDRPAPRFYDHKYLRVMIKANELPKGLPFPALKKGDVFQGPIRGQDADPKKDKQPRLYWVADPSALKTDLTADALSDRLKAHEAKFGVGSGEVIRVKVGWDPRRKALSARVYGKKGKAEFPARPELSADNLPEGTTPESLGRGKRAWGIVDVEEGKGGRRYVVRGKLSFEEPSASKDNEEAKTDGDVKPIDATSEAPDANAPEGGDSPSETVEVETVEGDSVASTDADEPSEPEGE